VICRVLTLQSRKAPKVALNFFRGFSFIRKELSMKTSKKEIRLYAGICTLQCANKEPIQTHIPELLLLEDLKISAKQYHKFIYKFQKVGLINFTGTHVEILYSRSI
jgi:hypothetical protein